MKTCRFQADQKALLIGNMSEPRGKGEIPPVETEIIVVENGVISKRSIFNNKKVKIKIKIKIKN